MTASLYQSGLFSGMGSSLTLLPGGIVRPCGNVFLSVRGVEILFRPDLAPAPKYEFLSPLLQRGNFFGKGFCTCLVFRLNAGNVFANARSDAEGPLVGELANQAYALGDADGEVQARLKEWRDQGRVRRLWKGDPSLWSG